MSVVVEFKTKLFEVLVGKLGVPVDVLLYRYQVLTIDGGAFVRTSSATLAEELS